MPLIWKDVESLDASDVSVQKFFQGMKVWISRPHIINRKIIGVQTIQTFKFASDTAYDNVFGKTLNLSNDVHETNAFCDVFLQCLGATVISEIPEFKQDSTFVTLQLRNLLSKHTKFKNVLEVLIINDGYTKFAFIPIIEKSESFTISVTFPYQIYLEAGRIHLAVPTEVTDQENVKMASLHWLKSEVLPKIVSWSTVIPKSPVMQSLKHISLQQYANNYNHLKSKYGKKLVENWPEKTDPLKYVYEDIAIAAYIITLWEEERTELGLKQKQSFVDLGCGNGLLVHLLSSEGHTGIGVDLRRRSVWDMYGPETNLVVKVIVPSDRMLFPEYDWIIGNHSDELTPWIPIIASRSSYDMRVFLLPCCCFTFDGKYDRPHPRKSKYNSYLDFVQELCEVAGFRVERDKLRIPSTKRVCFICSSRTYDVRDEEMVDSKRTQFIKEHSKSQRRCQEPPNRQASDHIWTTGFKPRDEVEVIRNCTTLDQTFKDETVQKIAEILIRDANFVELDTHKGKLLWNRGGSCSLKDVATMLNGETLKKLKDQCGGLQTLLRNHKNIFSVDKAIVSLSIPSEETLKRTPENTKNRRNNTQKLFLDKKCYFYFHHPQGCPLSDNDCSFSHVL